VQAIPLYLEQIGDARKFMSAARRAARTKPVIVLKPRRFPAEPDDAVFAAAFRRAGLLRVDDSDELLGWQAWRGLREMCASTWKWQTRSQ
jgi:acetyltransferase